MMSHLLSLVLRFAVVGPLLLWVGTTGAADVGRVVLAAGDTVAVRGNQTIRLILGGVVQDSDVLRTGAASNLQVRFTDETIISMRENSELRVDEYNFTGKQDGSESMGLRLLKGGLRVVTGLVGRSNEKNFALRSITATIGIRGTDFGTALCQQDCFNTDGSLAPDGQYGRVHGQSHGTNQINVANQRDQRTFGINENFYVADANSIVEPLLTPPEFVASRLESRKQGGTGAAGGTGSEGTTTGGAPNDGRPNDVPPATAGDPNPFVATETRSSSGGYVATGELNSTVVETPTLALLGAFNPSLGGFVTTSNLTTSPAGAASDLTQSQTLTGFSIPSGSGAGAASNGASGTAGTVIDQTVANSLNAHWGRWTSGSVTSSGSTTTIANTNQFHYLYGPLTPYDVIASKTGIFAFTNPGGLGTTPTNQTGALGTFTPQTISVNFTAQTVTIPANQAFNFAGAENYLFNGGTAPIQRGNGGAFFTLSSTGSCNTGTCQTGENAVLDRTGIFMGSRGDHLGVSFSARQTTGTTPNGRAQTVRIYTCGTC